MEKQVMTDIMRKSGYRSLLVITVLIATLFCLSSSLAQSDALAQPLPSALASAMRSEAARPVLLPDGRLLTLNGSQLILSTTGSGATKAVIQHISLPWFQQFASVTVVSDGRVLIWGGVDEHGQTIARGLWLDSTTGDLAPAANLPLAARAGGTATVLSDGRVLFAGGWSSQSGGMPQAELWNPKTNAEETLASALTPARAGQVAVLLPDGSVQFSGGFDLDGRSVATTTVFDPTTRQFREVNAKTLIVPVNGMSQPKLMASIPAASAADFPADGVLSLRFSEPMDPRTINTQTIMLLGPGGKTPAKVMAVEGGRLAFITPARDLFPGAHYTLFVQGVASQRQTGLPFTAIDFTVAAESVQTPSDQSTTTRGTTAGQAGNATGAAHTVAGGTEGAISPSASQPERVMTGSATPDAVTTGPCLAKTSIQVMHCRLSSYIADGAWYPGQDVGGAGGHGHWRVNQPDMTPQEIAAAELMLKPRGGSGSTGVTGRIELVDGTPIGNVDVSIGNQHARTSSSGWFTLTGVPAGHQTLFVDGTTANTSGHRYGQFVVGVNLLKGVARTLPYRMYLPRILPRDVVDIPSPTTRDMVITQPDMPGLEIHIPKGTVIKDHDGKIVTELAVVPTPVNRAPFPTAANFPIYFSIEPAGSTVQNIDPRNHQGIQVIYPNYTHLAPGATADFFLYHPEDGWKVYGQGHVSADGEHVVPDPGVDLVWVMGGSYYLSNSHSADVPQGKPCGCKVGDPVDLYSGTLEEHQTDIAIRDIVPLTLTRYFHTMALASPSRGINNQFGGWRSNYDMWINSTDGFTAPSITLPNGNSLAFTQGAALPGDTYTWTYAGSPSPWDGAVLEAVNVGSYARCAYASDTGECYLLTLKDGTQYQFDRLLPNELTFIRDRFGNQLALTWNAGLLQQVTSPSGRWINFTYNGDNTVAQATDSSGRAWTYAYSSQSLPGGTLGIKIDFLTAATYPDKSAWSYTYDTNPLNGNWGALLTMTDRDGHRMTNVYSTLPSNPGSISIGARRASTQVSTNSSTYSWYAVKQQILPDGSSYNFTDTNGVWQVTYPNGHVIAVKLDPISGYPASITRGYGTSLAQTTTYVRDSVGRVNSMTDPLGRKTTYTYDAKGNVTSVTRLAGTANAVTSHYTWTSDYNQIASYSDGLGHTTTFGYTNGCLTSIKDPLGNATRIACSATGQPSSIIDPLGHTTTFAYQGYDLRSVTDPLGRTTTFTTDSLGRLVAVSNPLGNVARRVYDVDDRVTSLVDPMNRTTTLGYDAMGNVTAVTLPNAGAIHYAYDVRDRLIKRTDALGHADAWTYDGMGEIKTHTDRKGQTTTYSYDALGRRIQSAFADGSAIATAYDAGNRIIKLQDSTNGTLQFGWNGLDDLTQAVSPQGTVNYTYDALGRRTSMTAGAQVSVGYAYDNANRLTSLTQGSAHVAFSYDAANRRSTLTLPNGVKMAYGYDAANQVTSIGYTDGSTTLGNLTYAYDAAGRRINAGGSFASGTLPTATTANSTFDLNNRQTGANGKTLQYDADGNLTSDGTRTYVWNARNQLVQIKQGTSVIDSFSYDALGRRQSKSIGGEAAISYLYDGINPVQEKQGTAVTPILEGSGVDEYFARPEATGPAYMLTDAQGSVIALTDSAGALIQQYHYGPYGESNANNAGITNPFQYTGRENDGDGLYYYRARYYSPSMKRFISEDPIGFGGGQDNFYAYVGGDPLDYVDSYGLWSFTIGGYLGPGLEFTFGNDSGHKFMTLRVGLGLGGGVSFDPKGGIPGDRPEKPCRGGIVLSDSIQLNANVGPISAGLEGGVERNYANQQSGFYGGPSGGLTGAWGFGAGGSIGGQFTEYQGSH